MVELVVSGDVLAAHRRKDKRAEHRQPHLSAVRVAREHQVDQREAWVVRDVVGVVGLVDHQDDWRSGLGRDRHIQVRLRGSGII